MIPITGRQLTLPEGPIFNLQQADHSSHIIGQFRSWAGYKNLGADGATDGLVHFQHILSFAGSDTAGRTGIHAHFAHAHIVIPTSGRGVFSYDGVVTTPNRAALSSNTAAPSMTSLSILMWRLQMRKIAKLR
jgi:hypothetical protein